MPGNGRAIISTGRGGPSDESVIRSAARSSRAPVASSTSSTASRCEGVTPPTVTEPCVMAAAKRSVAVSIRSGMIRCVVPSSCSTPSISSVSVPRPSIRAPIEIRNRPKSTTSGSRAAPRRMVFPWAKTAAHSTLAVPVTVGPRGPLRSIVVPTSRSARATT